MTTGLKVLNGLDLFSGIGGIGLALSPWVRTVAYCEQDRYAQAVLMSRMRAGDIDRAPIWDDVRTLRGDMLGGIDIIFGGFPCQDISVAGTGKGLEGKRSGLFFEIMRLVDEVRPAFVFLENVPAIRTRGLNRVIYEFTARGYDCRWTVLSAASVGAPHLRERWFLLAHADRIKLRNSESGRPSGLSPITGNHGAKESLADANGLRKLSEHETGELAPNWACDRSWWSSEPDVGRVAHGVPARVDRTRCLGNTVVPLQARTAFTRLLGIEAAEGLGGCQ